MDKIQNSGEKITVQTAARCTILLKKLITCFLLFFLILSASGQSKKIDTLRLALSKAVNADTTRLNILKSLSFYYADAKPDSALIFDQEGYEIAQNFNRLQDEAYFFTRTGDAYANLGNYARCLNYYYKAKNFYHEINDVPNESSVYNNIGLAYDKQKDYQKALLFSKLGIKILNNYKAVHPLNNNRDRQIEVFLYLNTGEQYLHLKQLDSAGYYTQLGFATQRKNHVQGDVLGPILYDFGEIEKIKGNTSASLNYFRKSVSCSIAEANMGDLSGTYLSIADLYHKEKLQDSAEYYGQKALGVAVNTKLLQDVLNASQALYTYFEEDNNLPLSHKYLKLATITNDRLFSQDKVRQLLAIDFDERQKQHDIDAAVEKNWNTMRTYLSILGMVTFSVVAFLFWRESRRRAKTNKQLQKQQHELDLINQNLESMVYDRTKDLEDKNDKLFKYSYYLSHQIRGPVSTIKGLVNIEKEGLVEQDDFVKMISVCVADIDSKILEINDILHEPVK